VEFGVPTDNDASNDVIIARKQYTISYNPQRGGPNWVSWDLSASHLGSRNRCDCYSADTALVRLGYADQMYTTLDYIGSGYDRGHMEPSADQTTTDGENATTFFLTNFLPQQHGLNAGPWEDLENALRDSVRAGREAYIVAGGIYTNGVGLGSLKGEGKILIPDSTWKIVVMMPANTGLANVTSATDMNVFVVNMPNVATPPSPRWEDYQSTVQKIQQSTGYDFLSALPETIQCRVERRNCAPTARISGSGIGGGTEGQSLHFDGSTSSDPDAGDALQYRWSVDGVDVGSGATLDHVFADNGTYQVALVVTDNGGATNAATTSVSVSNVAPVVAFSGATILRGESYTASGTFTDPGTDVWTATVSYGDGSGTSALALTGKAFALQHTYGATGVQTVTVTVSDADGGSGTRTAQVTVLSSGQGITTLASMVSSLASSGALEDGDAKWLANKLDVAGKELARSNDLAARNQLQQAIERIEAAQRAGRLSGTDAEALTTYAMRILASMA
jgi:endonuclease G